MVRRCFITLGAVVLALAGCFESAGGTSADVPAGSDATTIPSEAETVDAILRYCMYAQAGVEGTRAEDRSSLGECLREAASDVLYVGWDGDLKADFKRLVLCAANGATQAAFTDCATLGRAAQCAGRARTACDGDVLINKRWGYCQVVDCALTGQKCLGGTDGNDPSILACTTGEACTGSYTCDGRKVLQCTAGKLWVVRGVCPDGQACTVYDDGSVGCATRACTGETAKCEGSVLTRCAKTQDSDSKNHNLYSVDCASAGLQCVPDGGFNGYGKPLCNVADDGECATFAGTLCAGTKIAACIRGKVEFVDCTDYGLTKCVASPQIPGGARCE